MPAQQATFAIIAKIFSIIEETKRPKTIKGAPPIFTTNKSGRLAPLITKKSLNLPCGAFLLFRPQEHLSDIRRNEMNPVRDI